ncbi:hypothetical protein N9P60_00565 [bacterium]|nr:hypothetical protein [bacterium]MDB4125013.1 hypothetical protein [Schleiferiaceae bacterium]MDB4319733.1 hypothetical protein [bacterium]
MDNRDRILFIMVGGVMALLTIIVLGDFWISLKENRPIDDDVVQLLQMSITGLIGIIGGYFGSKNVDNKE